MQADSVHGCAKGVQVNEEARRQKEIDDPINANHDSLMVLLL